jgi:hypothetical protein
VALDGHASDRYGHLFPRGDDGAELAEAEKAKRLLADGAVLDRPNRPLSGKPDIEPTVAK